MIVSRCCHAELIAASAIYSAQLYDDWYECSQCERVCATMQINITNRDVEDE